MRFDTKEMTRLAQAHASKFSKEGLLWMKNKQEGLFKKGEVYSERWCRLRGNLLFYFKSKDSVYTSEPSGLLVIERASVQHESDDCNGLLFLFSIIFEGEDRTSIFAAESEKERDAWIRCLHVASYECMKMQVESLREQIRSKTGQDPLTSGTRLSDDGTKALRRHASISADCPVEICIGCTNLPLTSTDQPPSAFVIISTITPPQQQWVQTGQTEVIEKCVDPQFLTTIGFGDNRELDHKMRVKLVVYNIKERMTGLMTEIGQVIFTMTDILRASNSKLQLRLNSQDYANAGSITVMSWTLEAESNPSTSHHGRRSTIRSKPNRLDMLKTVCENVFIKSFKFDSLHGHKLAVYEYMAESRLCFNIPLQLLRIWIDQEKTLIDNLQDLGELKAHWAPIRHVMLKSHHTQYLSVLNLRLKAMNAHTGPNFKSSARKGEKDLEFIPVNLHIQRMTVDNEESGACGGYDTVTSGSFMAAPQKFKDGGLRRLLKTLYNTYSADSTLGGKPKIERSAELLDSIHTVKEDSCHCCERLRELVLTTKDKVPISHAMNVLKHKVRHLIELCDDSLLSDTYRHYLAASVQPVSPRMTKNFINTSPHPINVRHLIELCDDSLLSDTYRQYLAASVQPVSPRMSKTSSSRDGSPQPESAVKIANLEPWELSCINTDASLLCVQTMVDDYLSHDTPDSQSAVASGNGNQSAAVSDICQNIVKLKSFVSMLVRRAVCALTFLSLSEHRDNIPLLHSIKYRRDVVFSQAVTSLATAFLTKLRSSIHDDQFLRQLMTVGLLAQFEGLLTCHSDELGMIEDMCVGVRDLRTVTFKMVKSKNEKDTLPEVVSNSSAFNGYTFDANRHSLTFNIPLPTSMFDLLPHDLQKGQCVKVTPVFFNIGINEQVILAERLGDMSVQEEVNINATDDLIAYYTQYLQHMPSPDAVNQNAQTIDTLIKQLQYNVTTTLSKNVEVLHTAAEITRKLGGLRFISCKSGKDRTSMAVTLEQVQLLQRRHSLAPHVFNQALACFRSEGVRRENTLKNVGVRKYAFTSLQLPLMPKLYRPPNGTYGNVIT